jgi:predicted dehydrogenase
VLRWVSFNEKHVMVKIGLVGIGFMGWIHYLAWKRIPDIQLAAFASRDPQKRSGDWRGIRGNFGPPGERIDVSGLTVYSSIEDLLNDPSIDLVDLCLPPHAHVSAVKAALDAGKHVLCEKPLALTAEDSQELVRAAVSAQRKLMVAQVLPFMPEFAYLVEAQRSGRYGRLLTGHFRRVIGPPDWIPDFYDVDRVGGPLIDLHVHDAHLLRLLFGLPTRVTTRSRMKGDVPQFFESLIDFLDGRFASATCGVTDSPGRPFCHGYEVQFEAATLQFEFVALQDGTELMPLKVFHADGKIERPKLGSNDPVDAFVAELAAAAKMARGVADEPILDGRLAADAISICQAQARAAKSGDTERI